VVKVRLMETLIAEGEKSIRDLLAETLHTVVIHDFPDNWPELIPFLVHSIQTGAQDMATHGLAVHNALLALRKVTKRYEYKSKEQRGPLNEIVRTTFPLLLPLGQQLSGEQVHSLEAAMMLKQILKIFWSSTQFYLPCTTPDAVDNNQFSSKPEQLQPWFDILTRALRKPLPEASTGLEPVGQPTSVEARNAWPWWKVKKWSVQIMSRLFSRYGIPAYAESDDVAAKEFAVYFSGTVAPQFLGPVCESLNLRPTQKFCTDRVVHLCLTFVDLAVELSSTYKLLKPHLDFLLYQVCFPTMCLTADDIESFENDPVEFVQKQNSPLADFYDPRMSAITLLVDLVKHRGQDVTQGLLGRMTEILHRYPSSQNHIEKDGALLTFGSLSRYLLAKEKYNAQLEALMVTSVFPDFNSPVAFLRFRACWMVQQFSTIKWSDDGNHLRNLIQMVLLRLSDPALPVQIEASKAVRFLIEIDGAEETLLPVLPQLLTEYFRIMNEIGNDEVVSALQVLLDKFGNHIEPHAVALVTQLTSTFGQYCVAGEDEDDDDAALAAANCLECVATVLKGVCSNESIVKSLEPLLLPLVLKILGTEGDFIEYLESALDILTFLTFFQSHLSPELWQAFPLIYQAFDQWAYDYLNLMCPCLQSYILKAPDVFLAGTTDLLPTNETGSPTTATRVPFMDLIISIAAKTVTNDRASESECRYALSLFMCVLHNCPGKIDAYIPLINDISLGKLGQQINMEASLTRVSIYQVLASALYYNPHFELLELEKRGVTSQVFSKWLQDVETLDRPLPRKLSVLGFASILTLPTSQMPPSVVSSIPQLVEVTVKLALKLKDDAEKASAPDAGGASNDNNNRETADEEDNAAFEGDDLDEGFSEDQDVTNEIDEAYRKALSGTADFDENLSKFLMGDWDEDGDDVDDEYTSPLDHVNELLTLDETLRMAFSREPAFFQQVQSVMSPEGVASCQNLVSSAELVRSQVVAAAQQQLQVTQQASQQS
jgi:importin-7